MSTDQTTTPPATGGDAPGGATAERPRGTTAPSALSRALPASGLILLTLVLGLVWAVVPATGGVFLSKANIAVVLLNQSVLLVITMGVLIPLICHQYDFSIGAIAGVSALIAAIHLSHGGNMLVAGFLALGAAVLVGAVNGVLVTLVGVDSVIVTLAMTTLLAGVATWLTGGTSILSGVPDILLALSDPVGGAFPLSFLVALLITAFTAFVLRSTQPGRYLHAIGSNLAAARLVGLPTKRLTLAVFVVSALYGGVAGLIMLGITGAANPRSGPELTLPAIAAVFLSVAAIKLGRFNVWGALVAILFLAVLNSGLSLMGVEPYVNDFANGLALIAGVSLSAVISRKKRV